MKQINIYYKYSTRKIPCVPRLIVFNTNRKRKTSMINLKFTRCKLIILIIKYNKGEGVCENKNVAFKVAVWKTRSRFRYIIAASMMHNRNDLTVALLNFYL